MTDAERAEGPENDYSGGFQCLSCDSPLSQAFLQILRLNKFRWYPCPNLECNTKVQGTFKGIEFEV